MESSKRLKKYASLVRNFNSFPLNTRATLTRNIDSEFYKFICETAYNLLTEKVPVSEDQIKQLQRYKSILRSLSNKRKSKLSVTKKRLYQRGKGLLPILFSIITPLLSKLIA